MAGSAALLLLLGLGLCCPGIWGQRYTVTATFRDKSLKAPQVGQQLKLECVTSKEDSGVFWIRQDKAGTLHFIVFISGFSRVIFEKNERTSTRFTAGKDNKVYWLAVRSFTPRDQGYYFCLTIINQALYFSSSQAAFLPVTTTAASPTPTPTTQLGITEKDPCPKTPDPETSKEKELKLFCEFFILVPLAGFCLLLLFALAVTVLLCQQTIRRRCRCKRHVNGKPDTKPRSPNRHR